MSRETDGYNWAGRFKAQILKVGSEGRDRNVHCAFDAAGFPLPMGTNVEDIRRCIATQLRVQRIRGDLRYAAEGYPPETASPSHGHTSLSKRAQIRHVTLRPGTSLRQPHRQPRTAWVPRILLRHLLLNKLAPSMISGTSCRYPLESAGRTGGCLNRVQVSGGRKKGAGCRVQEKHRHARDQLLRASQSIPLTSPKATAKEPTPIGAASSRSRAVRRWNVHRFRVTVQTPRRIRPGLMGFVPQLILQSVVFG
jgi:hypothetical protein